ncbi:chymotrypsin-1-like [Phlebotomus argentipes]|uniref:chymotrypsin-1-like n=1 Tax=Phlebotomus argentipes TaxID=94469 RepID=UPI0028930740|nr:chymotrypsin-1-like [Phlebotomus argentipes]
MQFHIFLLIYLALSVSAISRGRNAQQEEFPYVCSLQTSFLVLKSHRCGAVVLHPEWLVTAGQCGGNALGDFEVLCGVTNLGSEGQRRKVDKFIVHKDFAGKAGQRNDIAMIKLTEPLVLDKSVNIAKMPVLTLSGSAFVAGWGEKSGGLLETLLNMFSQDLQAAQVTMRDQFTCAQLLKEHGVEGLMDETKICSTAPENSGICSGDAGSPLVQQGVVLGIASWHSGCASGVPSVFTSVAPHSLWIKNVYNSNGERQ